MGLTLRIAVERCTGCGNCELACAFAHARADRPGQPRIHVVRTAAGKGMPIVCLQCDDAACVAACPVAALRRNEASGGIDHDADRCLRCRACVGACPFGNIAWDERAHRVAKCDLCGGDPECAKFCPTGALATPLGVDAGAFSR